MSQTACNFSPSTKGFSASMAEPNILFLKEVLCVYKPQVSWNTRLFISLALTWFFPHWGFTFPRAHWFSNRGVEWREPSIYISLYVGKDLNMALYQDKRVVLFLLHSTEEVHKKLVIIFWEKYYFRHILAQYVYPETHVQKWETFWYNKNSPSVGTVEKHIQSCNWHGLQPNSVRTYTQWQVNSSIM